MLRRRELATSPYRGSSLPTTLPFANSATAFPGSRHQSQWNGVRSYFSSSSSSSPHYASKRSSNNDNNKYIWLYYIPAILLLIAPWMFPNEINNDIAQYYNQVLELKTEQRKVVKEIDAKTKSVRDANVKISTISKDNDYRFKELRDNGGVFTERTVKEGQYDEANKIEEALISRMDILEEHIQHTSAKLAVQKFGADPYRVKVTLTDIYRSTSYFVIELAPLSEMPHAVYHFLQMVDQNLWDGLSFILGHGTASSTTMQPTVDYWVAKPLMVEKEHHHPSWESKRFEDANLTHLSFTEHSTKYPPAGKYKYSVAFSGHPGGPSFYIRMDDAEESVIDVHQQPSTFGTVVEGTDILDRYWSLSAHQNLDQANDRKDIESHHLELLTIESMELIRS